MPLIAEADVHASAEPLLQFRRQSEILFFSGRSSTKPTNAYSSRDSISAAIICMVLRAVPMP
jgi:hypothetical protein